MEDKNIALLGFVSSAADYLKEQIKDDSEEIKSLEEVDLDKIKSELENKLGSSFSGAKNKSDDLISAGREAFDNFISKSPALIDEFKDIFDVDFKKENDEHDEKIVSHLIDILKKPDVNDETDELVSQIARAASDTILDSKPKVEVPVSDDNKELDSIFSEILANENLEEEKIEEPTEVLDVQETKEVKEETQEDSSLKNEEENKFDPDEIKQLIKDTISEFFVEKKEEAAVKFDEVIDSFDVLKNVTEKQEESSEEKEPVKEEETDLEPLDAELEEFNFDSNELEEVEYEELNPNNNSLLDGVFKRVDEPEDIQEVENAVDDVFLQEEQELDINEDEEQLQEAASKLEEEVNKETVSDNFITVSDILGNYDKTYDDTFDFNDALRQAENSYLVNYETSFEEHIPTNKENKEIKDEEIVLNTFNIEEAIEKEFLDIQSKKTETKELETEEDDYTVVDGVLVKESDALALEEKLAESTENNEDALAQENNEVVNDDSFVEEETNESAVQDENEETELGANEEETLADLEDLDNIFEELAKDENNVDEISEEVSDAIEGITSEDSLENEELAEEDELSDFVDEDIDTVDKDETIEELDSLEDTLVDEIEDESFEENNDELNSDETIETSNDVDEANEELESEIFTEDLDEPCEIEDNDGEQLELEETIDSQEDETIEEDVDDALVQELLSDLEALEENPSEELENGVQEDVDTLDSQEDIANEDSLENEELAEEETEPSDFIDENIDTLDKDETIEDLDSLEDTLVDEIEDESFEENNDELNSDETVETSIDVDEELETSTEGLDESNETQELDNEETSIDEDNLDNEYTLNDENNDDVPLSEKLSSFTDQYKAFNSTFTNDYKYPASKDDYNFEVGDEDTSDSISSFLKELKDNDHEVDAKEEAEDIIANLIDQCKTLCPEVEEEPVKEEEPIIIDNDYIEAYKNRTLEEMYIPNPGIDAIEESIKEEIQDKEVVDEVVDNETLEEETNNEETVESNDDAYLNDLFDDFTSNEYSVDEALDKQKQEEAKKKEIYNSIVALYPYLSNGFIKGVYDLKQSFANDYKEGEKIVILHRLRFEDLNGLRQFVDVMISHNYLVNVDEKQMIVDTFKEHINSDGKILTDIFEIANQAKLLTGDYEGYRIIEDEI